MGNLSELLLHLTSNGASEPLSGKKEKKVKIKMHCVCSLHLPSCSYL